MGVGVGVGLLDRVGDKDVVKDGARLDLPDLKADCANVCKVVDLGVLDVVGVGDLGVDPLADVLGVLDLLGGPGALVVGVVDHGGLPLSVELLVPVLGHLGVGVDNGLGNVVVPLGLLVLGVVNVLLVHPVGRLGLGGVLDHLGREDVPPVLNRPGLLLLAVDKDPVRVVCAQHKPVQVRRRVKGALDLVRKKVVLTLVVDDRMRPPRPGPANVRPKHNVVRRVSAKRSLVHVGREQLEVSPSAVDVLLVLGRKLEHKVRVLVVKRLLKLGRDRVEPCILRCLHTLLVRLVPRKLARRKLECSHLGLGLELGRNNPPVFPRSCITNVC